MSQGFARAGQINVDTDGTLAANSDALVPSQKAVKTYVDTYRILQNAGHPQGAVSARVGSLCIDTTNNKLYQKLGGGSTAYGWYYVTPGAMAFNGPMPWLHVPSAVQAASGAARGNGYGIFEASSADTSDAMAYTGVTTASEVYVSGKRFVSIASTNVSGTNTYGITGGTTGNHRQILDDDIDVWVDMRSDPSAITTMRYWFGITSAAITDTATLGSASNGSIMIRYSTADGGNTTDFLGATQINGGANQSLTAALANGTLVAATVYRLRIRFVRQGSPTAYFSVNDGAELSLTSNIPTTGNTYFLTFGLTTKAAAVRAFVWRCMGGLMGS